MTREELNAIEAFADAATRGPWRGGLDGSPHKGRVLDDGGETIAEVWCGAVDGHGATNAAFIASAREDVPALVAEVRRLERELAEAKNQHKLDLLTIYGAACPGWAGTFRNGDVEMLVTNIRRYREQKP